MRSVIADIAPEVEGEIEALFGHTLFLGRPTAARLAGWRRRAQIGAGRKAGYSYAGYGQLKIASVIDTIALLLYQVGRETGPDRWRRVRDPTQHAEPTHGFRAGGPRIVGRARHRPLALLPSSVSKR